MSLECPANYKVMGAIIFKLGNLKEMADQAARIFPYAILRNDFGHARKKINIVFVQKMEARC